MPNATVARFAQKAITHVSLVLVFLALGIASSVSATSPTLFGVMGDPSIFGPGGIPVEIDPSTDAATPLATNGFSLGGNVNFLGYSPVNNTLYWAPETVNPNGSVAAQNEIFQVNLTTGVESSFLVTPPPNNFGAIMGLTVGPSISSSVPEPPTVWLVVTAAAGLLFLTRRHAG